jgi:hypothetical protein
MAPSLSLHLLGLLASTLAVRRCIHSLVIIFFRLQLNKFDRNSNLGIGLGKEHENILLKRLQKPTFALARWMHCRVLIIDESEFDISLLSLTLTCFAKYR